MTASATQSTQAGPPFTCSICREDKSYKPGDPKVVQLACQHIFDKVCLTQWLQQSKRSCPNCREEIAEELAQQIAPGAPAPESIELEELGDMQLPQAQLTRLACLIKAIRSPRTRAKHLAVAVTLAIVLWAGVFLLGGPFTSAIAGLLTVVAGIVCIPSFVLFVLFCDDVSEMYHQLRAPA